MPFTRTWDPIDGMQDKRVYEARQVSSCDIKLLAAEGSSDHPVSALIVNRTVV